MNQWCYRIKTPINNNKLGSLSVVGLKKVTKHKIITTFTVIFICINYDALFMDCNDITLLILAKYRTRLRTSGGKRLSDLYSISFFCTAHANSSQRSPWLNNTQATVDMSTAQRFLVIKWWDAATLFEYFLSVFRNHHYVDRTSRSERQDSQRWWHTAWQSAQHTPALTWPWLIAALLRHRNCWNFLHIPAWKSEHQHKAALVRVCRNKKST